MSLLDHNIQALSRLDGQKVEIDCTVTGISCAQHHGIRTKVQLADATGCASVLLDNDLEPRIQELHRHLAIRARMSVNIQSWGIGGQLIYWAPIADQADSNAAQLLPVTECPSLARDSLASLVGIVNALTTPAIKQAMNALITEAGPKLLRARASWNDHHAFDGGLLIHTIEVIQLSLSEARTVFPADGARHDLIALIAFAHDLAKAQSHVPGSGNAFSTSLGHKLDSIACVAPYLKRLAEQDPIVGTLAGRMLDWLCQSKYTRRIRQCPEAELVQRADEFSAMRQFVGHSPIHRKQLRAGHSLVVPRRDAQNVAPHWEQPA